MVLKKNPNVATRAKSLGIRSGIRSPVLAQVEGFLY